MGCRLHNALPSTLETYYREKIKRTEKNLERVDRPFYSRALLEFFETAKKIKKTIYFLSLQAFDYICNLD